MDRDSDKRRSLRSLLLNGLKIAVSAGMLAYVLLVQVDLGELGQSVAHARWGYLVVAALLALAGVALRAVRWLVLLRALDIQVPLGRLVRLYFVGTFFNIFLLSGFGGDAVRMIELARDSKQAPEAVGTVLVDRANGLWVLFGLGLLALPFAAPYLPPGTVAWIAAGSAGVVLGGWLVMGTRLVPWLGARIKLPGQAKLERFYRAVSGCGPAALARASGISLLFNLMNVTVSYLVARGLHVVLPFGIFVAFAPLLSLSLLLPSVGGLGVREAAHVLFYGIVHVGQAEATAMGLAQFGVQTLVPGLIGALIYVVEGAAGLRVRPAAER